MNKLFFFSKLFQILKLWKSWFIYISLFLHTTVFAGNDNFPIGARSWGMGNASVTLADAWSPFNNIALISKQQQIAVGYYYENRFGFSELTTMASSFILPHPRLGALGLSFYRFGDKLYNEQKIGLGYAYNIHGIHVGGQLDFLQVKMDLSEQNDGIQSKNSIGYEFGISADIIPKITFGAHIYNFTRTVLTQYETLNLKEHIPTIIRVGLGYAPMDKLILTIETEKDLDYDANIRGGVEYKIIKQLALRSGISTNPSSGYYGIGILLKMLEIDYALNTHKQLGFSHHASISYKFGSYKSGSFE